MTLIGPQSSRSHHIRELVEDFSNALDLRQRRVVARARTCRGRACSGRGGNVRRRVAGPLVLVRGWRVVGLALDGRILVTATVVSNRGVEPRYRLGQSAIWHLRARAVGGDAGGHDPGDEPMIATRLTPHGPHLRMVMLVPTTAVGASEYGCSLCLPCLWREPVLRLSEATACCEPTARVLAARAGACMVRAYALR